MQSNLKALHKREGGGPELLIEMQRVFRIHEKLKLDCFLRPAGAQPCQHLVLEVIQLSQ